MSATDHTPESIAKWLECHEGIQLHAVEIHRVWQAIARYPGCRLLVFGLGHDAPLWCRLNPCGRTVFLEDNPGWYDGIARAHPSMECHLIHYRHNIQGWHALLEQPKALELPLPREVRETSWDVVLVDAPAGYESTEEIPGRMSSIYMASKLVAGGGSVFVHDAERAVESAYCARFLGQDNLVSSVTGRATLEEYRMPGAPPSPLPGRYRKQAVRSWSNDLYAGYVVLSVEPTILIYTGTHQEQLDTFVPPLPPGLEADVVIEMLSWWMSPAWADSIARRYQSQQDGVHRMLMTNAPDEEQTRRERGIDGFHCNKEIFALDDVFTPQACVQRYNAIYVARLDPVKRHRLARRVKHLRLLTGGKGKSRFGFGLDEARPGDLSGVCLHPTARASFDWLDPAAVSAEINSSACGLALSPVEGMMRASIQYLLCGRPVVSTHSRGGRDVYYDDLTAIVVEDEEDAVWEAVRTLVTDRRDPREIRYRTLCRLYRYRYEFSRHIARLRVRFGGDPIPSERVFHDLFFGEHPFLLRYAGAGRGIGLPMPAFSHEDSAPDRFRLDTDRYRLIAIAPGYSLVRRDDGTAVARLTDSAAYILALLDGETSISQLIGELEAAFPRQPDVAEETRDAIAHFLELGALAPRWQVKPTPQ